MKFILDETKFILNENKRFLLEERFILNEDSLLEAGATIAHLRENIKRLDALLPQVLNALPLGINLDNPEIKTGCQAIQDLLVNKKDFKKLLDLIMGKTKAKNPESIYSKEELIIIEPLCDRISEGMSSVMQILKSLSQRSETELKGAIFKLQKKVPELKTNIEKLYDQVEQTEKEQEKYKYTLTQAEVVLKVGDTYDLNSLIKAEPKKDFEATFELDKPALAEVDNKGILTAKAEGETEVKISVESQELTCKLVVQKAYKYSLTQSEISLSVGDTYQLKPLVKVEPEKKDIEITFKVTKPDIATIDTKEGELKALAEGETDFKIIADGNELPGKAIVEKAKETETQEKPPEAGGKDWKVKYEKAVNKEAVIKEFIYVTWGKKGDQVMKIIKAFKAECESYGFRPANAETGKNGNPFINFISNIYLNEKDNYTVSLEAYNIIHNLVAANSISSADLVGAGKLKKANLIFCKALYELDPAVVKLYIKKQNAMLSTTTIPDNFESSSEMVFNILYKLPEITKFKDGVSSKDLKLNAMNTIEDLEAQWTGEVTEVPLADKEAKNKIASNAELLKQIETTENAVDTLVAMAIKFSSNEDITKAVKSCSEATRKMSETTTVEAIQKLVAKVERLYKIEKINATQALSLVKSILESDQFKLSKA